eukprot:COSAG05_NODE_22022_length_267_cov_1.238095_1_plen_20_part_10
MNGSMRARARVREAWTRGLP